MSKIIVECPVCGHMFDVTREVKNSESKNPARRLPAKAHLSHIHFWHKYEARKHCECCGCKQT